MANEFAYMSDDELIARFGHDGYMRLAKLGMLGAGRGSVQPVNNPGLPNPAEVYSAPGTQAVVNRGFSTAEYSPAEVEEALDYVNSFQNAPEGSDQRGRQVPYAQRFGENDENVFMRLAPGRERSSYALTRALNEQAEAEANATERLLRAGNESVPGPVRGERVMEAPHRVLSRLFGVPVSPELGQRTQILAEATGLPAEQAFKLAQLEAQGGGGRGTRRKAGLPPQLLQQIAVAGEISPDPVISEVAAGLNQQLRRVSSADDLAVSLAPLDVVRPEVLSSAAQEAAARASGAQLRPYRQLSEDQTRRLAEMSGKDRTKKRVPDEAAVMRAPGSVLSSGMEFDPREVLIPLLVAPKQADPRTGRLQVEQVYLGQDERGRAQFAPTLTKAGTVYVNPYAELPDWVMGKMGFDPVVMQPDKDVTGAQDANLLNAPVPDVGQSQYGLPPTADPGHGVRKGQVTRNPTFAEAIRSLLYRHSTPIRDYTVDMLEGGGRDVRDRVDGVDVFALGNKRDPETGKPLPITAYMQPPARAGRRIDVVTGEPVPIEGGMNEPPVASVRVGSPKKYQDSLWDDLDALTTAMIAQRTGRIVKDEKGDTRPAQQYGLMLNVAGNAMNPALVDYQRALLDEAGVPIPGATRNPLQEVLSFAAELASAPPGDQAIRRPLLLASEAEPIVAPSGGESRARMLQEIKRQVLERSRQPSNAAMTQAALAELQNAVSRIRRPGGA